MKSSLKGLGLASVGLELVVSVVLGVLGGSWLDRRLDSTPAFLMVGLVLGSAVGFRALLQGVRRLERGSKKDQGHGDEQER